MQFKDYYEILGVPAGADADVIKSAYRRLARKYHPDVSKEKDAESRFKAVNNRDKNFTSAKLKRRLAEIDASIGGYLAALDRESRGHCLWLAIEAQAAPGDAPNLAAIGRS